MARWRNPEYELIQKAITFYLKMHPGADRPSALSSVESQNGFNYVVLRDVTGVLAIFRAFESGELKYLTRWPKWVSNY